MGGIHNWFGRVHRCSGRFCHNVEWVYRKIIVILKGCMHRSKFVFIANQKICHFISVDWNLTFQIWKVRFRF